MIKDNKDLDNVPDNIVIWRYMSLEKFLSLIKNEELYFCRADLFEDKQEVTLPIIDKEFFRYSEENKKYWENERKRHFVNCWIESPHELSLMWTAYAKNGIAIKSSVGNLKSSFNDSSENIYLSRVKYIDYDNESSQDTYAPLNVLKLVFTKRSLFKQENEIRLLHSDYENKDRDIRGKSIKVDINVLIDEIVTSPNTDDNFLDMIETWLQSKGIEKCVIKSVL